MRMFGMETEYALSGTQSRSELLEELMEEARTRLPNLPSPRRRDLFLQNGARFYVDCGSHPEMTTPECTHPADVVRYAAAGERILAGLIDRLDRRRRADPTLVLRCNVDYSGAKTTWGCHESYLHRSDPEQLPDQLVPHLVSRVIYTGAGGFDPLSPGVTFTLSPRVSHIKRVVSDESTHARGIVHTKDEPLSGHGYHRLHLICGESLCSHLATYLKIGTTAIVVALIEAGMRPGEGVRMKHGLKAMKTIAADMTLKKKVTVAGRRKLTAIEIQRHYLELAETCLGQSFLPAWASDVCSEWRAALDRMEREPRSMATRLDWAIKREIMADQAARQGIDWEELPRWTHVMERIDAGLRAAGTDRIEVSLARALGPGSPIPDTLSDLEGYLRDHGLAWGRLTKFLHLRTELFEMDMRFGEVQDGIFASLERDGVLQHAAPGVEHIEEAMSEPPESGRARVRGKVVRARARREGHRCDWGSIWDMSARQLLDLSDPFEEEERWRPFRPRPRRDPTGDSPSLPPTDLPF